MPYALLIAAISFVGFLIGGIAGNGFVALVIGVALLIGAVAVLTVKYGKRQAK